MSDNLISDVVADVEANGAGDVKPTDGTEESSGEETSTEETPELKAKAEADKKTKAAAEIKKNNKKKFKIKVDQKEEDIDLDLDNEEEVRKHLQFSRAAQKRMAEMAEMKKDFTDLVTRMQKDPLSFLGDKDAGLGMDVEDLVKQYVEKRLADAEKTPEQLEADQNRAELQRLKQERENEKTERERERYEAAVQNDIIKYDQMMTKTLENSEFKKPSPMLVSKMSNYLILGVENGLDITPDDILPIVREEIQSEIRELINSAPEEVIEAMFGKQIFDRMRKKNLAKAKQAPVHASSVQDTGQKSGKAIKEADKVNYKQFFKF